ncbi:hypothetical protein ACR4XJ_08450 [Nitratidesulfovibrio sp. D1]|uniref:hypothetical protein n=1 Tax=Nitratidesulfovibrio sp. D1 TaxID=3440151 RepID=UPI003EBBA89D
MFACPATHEVPGDTPLPFSGLGHDLALAASRARLLAWIPVRRMRDARPHAAWRRGVERAPRRAGYALLVELGREIRGR